MGEVFAACVLALLPLFLYKGYHQDLPVKV
jgi:hypothetical protein